MVKKSHSVHVLEDQNTNLLHLINEFNGSQPSDVHAFVQTGHGVQSLSSGRKYLQGNLIHKYTGSFKGRKEQYAKNLLHYGAQNVTNEKLLKKSGLRNLKRGTGVLLSATRVAMLGYRGFSVSQLWNECIEDGVVTADEFALLGLAAGGIRIPSSILNHGDPQAPADPQAAYDLQPSMEQPFVGQSPVEHTFLAENAPIEPDAESVWSGIRAAFEHLSNYL